MTHLVCYINTDCIWIKVLYVYIIGTTEAAGGTTHVQEYGKTSYVRH